MQGRCDDAGLEVGVCGLQNAGRFRLVAPIRCLFDPKVAASSMALRSEPPRWIHEALLAQSYVCEVAFAHGGVVEARCERPRVGALVQPYNSSP